MWLCMYLRNHTDYKGRKIITLGFKDFSEWHASLSLTSSRLGFKCYCLDNEMIYGTLCIIYVSCLAEFPKLCTCKFASQSTLSLQIRFTWVWVCTRKMGISLSPCSTIFFMSVCVLLLIVKGQLNRSQGRLLWYQINKLQKNSHVDQDSSFLNSHRT